MNYYESAIDMIGNTPLLKLNRVMEKYNLEASLYAKIEGQNPAGSIKDRAAIKMIEDSEKEGKLKNDSIIIEPTSGNTGIGLALVGALKGYKVIIVMPDTMSAERILLMKVYGADVVLSDGSLGMQGAIDKAEELASNYGDRVFIARQFENKSNALAHYTSTGPEIYEALGGNIAALVAGVGTGGTITGLSHYLKEKNPDINIIAVEPASSPVLSEGSKGPHKIQGIGAGFVPKLLDVDAYDEVLKATDEESLSMFKELPKLEGIFSGISAGAALSKAIEVAKRDEYKGKNVVVILPDSGSRYLSEFE